MRLLATRGLGVPRGRIVVAMLIRTNLLIALWDSANDGFIKESAFDDFDYPMPKKYKDLCSVYSDEYFRLFNRRKI